MEGDDPFVSALRALCESEGGYKVVADKARVSPDNLWQILNGTKLQSGNARGVGPTLRGKLSAAFPNWLGNVVPITSRAVSLKRVLENVEIPQFETGGSMGSGLLLRDQPGMINSMRVSHEWLAKNVHHITNPKNLAIVTGFGDSMKPLYNPGDPLLVDRGVTTVDFDAIYFFRIGEEGFIKRLQRVPGEGLVALSENKAYKDWVIKADMDFEIFARVVKVWKGEDF